jgi:Coiled-coil domain-containing protein 55 (DUF2040)
MQFGLNKRTSTARKTSTLGPNFFSEVDDSAYDPPNDSKHQNDESKVDQPMYDFDSMIDASQTSSRSTTRVPVSNPKPPQQSRYISTLLARAQVRNAEREEVMQKKLEKQHEEEEKIYGKKDVFITDSYKATMENRNEVLKGIRISSSGSEVGFNSIPPPQSRNITQTRYMDRDEQKEMSRSGDGTNVSLYSQDPSILNFPEESLKVATSQSVTVLRDTNYSSSISEEKRNQVDPWIRRTSYEEIEAARSRALRRMQCKVEKL